MRQAYKYSILLLLLSSCLSSRNAPKRQYDIATKFPAVLAEAAARFIPAKPPVYIKGEVITKSDTAYLPGDSVDCPPNKIDSIPFKVPCPPRQIIRDTVKIVDTIEVDAYAYERTSLTEKLRASQNQNTVDAGRITDLKKDRNWWRMAAIITWILLALYIGLRIAKPKLL